MGNLSWGIPGSFQRSSRPCQFEDHPTDSRHIIPRLFTALVFLDWNGWSPSFVIGGHLRLEQVVTLARCAQAGTLHTTTTHRQAAAVGGFGVEW